MAVEWEVVLFLASSSPGGFVFFTGQPGGHLGGADPLESAGPQEVLLGLRGGAILRKLLKE